MFSGFNTARKAAWLKLTQLECASDRKDLQMLLRSIRKAQMWYILKIVLRWIFDIIRFPQQR